jgi:hypothetical protein
MAMQGSQSVATDETQNLIASLRLATEYSGSSIRSPKPGTELS